MLKYILLFLLICSPVFAADIIDAEFNIYISVQEGDIEGDFFTRIGLLLDKNKTKEINRKVTRAEAITFFRNKIEQLRDSITFPIIPPTSDAVWGVMGYLLTIRA